MKTCISLISAALLVWIFTGCSKHASTVTTGPQTVSFRGFTNGYVGAIAPVFAKLNTNRAAVIQQWLADGTNSAVFVITNQQSCDIVLFPIGRLRDAGASGQSAETPILNAPNFSGIRLQPGQVSTIQVAVLPHPARWRVDFFYTPIGQRVRFSQVLNSIVFHKPIRVQSRTVESDIIDISSQGHGQKPHTIGD